MPEPINVFVNEDPYLSVVLVQTVTKSGKYYNKSDAHRDLAGGHVLVNGKVQTKPVTVLPAGLYTIQIGTNIYSIKLSHSAFE